MGQHAILSASSSGRWLECTKSARLEQKFPSTSSSYADKGTLAHAVGECYLRELCGEITATEAELLMATHIQNTHYSEELRKYAEDYAYFVWNQHRPGKTHLFIEQRLDMTEWVEEGFGTGDAIIIGDKVLIFDDLKYGKGVPVYAENNSQLMLYALGAYFEFRHIFEIELIQLNIYQPRLDNISTWEITVQDLLKWAEEILVPRAKLAYNGEGEFKPGKHCTFCKAKAQCRALAEYNLELAQYEFAPAEILTDGEIAAVIARSSEFSNWMESLAGYAMKTMLEGKEMAGLKIVEGRSIRKYSNEEQVAETLKAKGYTDVFKKPALLGLGEMEKKLTKPVFSEIVGPLLIRPEGKPTLASVNDKRPAFVPSNGFENYTETE